MGNRTIFLVGIGGQSIDGYEEHDCFDSAIDACLELAECKAVEDGLDPNDIESYGTSDRAGACPPDDDGAYWPIVIGKVTSQ